MAEEGQVLQLEGSEQLLRQTDEGPVGVEPGGLKEGEDIQEIGIAETQSLFTAAGRGEDFEEFALSQGLEIPDVKMDETPADNIVDKTASIAGAQTEEELAEGVAGRQQEVTEEKEAQEEERAGAFQMFKDFITNRETIPEIRERAEEELGIDTAAQFQRIQQETQEAARVREQLNKVKAQAQENLDAALERGEGRQSSGFISRRQAAIERRFSRRINALAADLGARAQNIAALKGNLNLARGMISDVVDAATAEQQFELQSIQSFIQLNENALNRLSQEEQNLFKTQLTLAQNRLQQARQDERFKQELILSNPLAAQKAGITAQAALNMSREQVATAMQPHLAEQQQQQQEREERLDEATIRLRETQAAKALADASGVSTSSANAVRAFADEDLTEEQSEVLGRVMSKAQSLGAATEREGVFGTIGTIENARDILDLFKAGVETGPVRGRVRRGVSVFGIPLLPGTRAFEATSEEEDELSAATTALTANFIKAISGAQVSDKEREFLMGTLPDETKTIQANKAGLKVILETLSNRYSPVVNENLDILMPEIFEDLSDEEADEVIEDIIGTSRGENSVSEKDSFTSLAP